jgi:hypothetical protein
MSLRQPSVPAFEARSHPRCSSEVLSRISSKTRSGKQKQYPLCSRKFLCSKVKWYSRSLNISILNQAWPPRSGTPCSRIINDMWFSVRSHNTRGKTAYWRRMISRLNRYEWRPHHGRGWWESEDLSQDNFNKSHACTVPRATAFFNHHTTHGVG